MRNLLKYRKVVRNKMLIDSHAHLDMGEFEEDLGEVLGRALESGVTEIISVGIDLPSSAKALELARKYDFVYSTVGYHPHNASEADLKVLRDLADLTLDPKVVAWGEIGLDFFRRHSPPKTQMEAFERQLDMAGELGLPVIVHDREAHEQLSDILRKKRTPLTGVIHCFSGDYTLARLFIDMGFYISIPGTVTYKKAAMVQEVAARIPLERLLVETDAPYLSPVPYRGKRNEPAFVKYTAQEIARLRGMEFQELALATSQNARALFKLRKRQ
jgi:TatD DNase family protein